jgi:hypothetical protein
MNNINHLILPEDVWESVAIHLCPKDIFSLLRVNRSMHGGLGRSIRLWKTLIERDNNGNTVDATEYDYYSSSSSSSSNDDTSEQQQQQHEEQHTILRNIYRTIAYKNELPSVKWYPVQLTLNGTVNISGREGHLCCVMKNNRHETNREEQRRIVITGGFSDDQNVYMINCGGGGGWTTTILQPEHNVGFVYGGSLTSLPSIERDGETILRAVRFGGFRAGGYSHETNQVAILTIKETDATMSKKTGVSARANWEIQQTQNSDVGVPRAYHTATLLCDRYLLVTGGMMCKFSSELFLFCFLFSEQYQILVNTIIVIAYLNFFVGRGSIMNVAILDTETWTWVDKPIFSMIDLYDDDDDDDDGDTEGVAVPSEVPSGRHGHSIVLDEKRNRLVMFGGGSGTDLLRSGKDSTEVWEIKMRDGWKTNLIDSLPWKWNKIHNGENTDATPEKNRLSPAEALCLGRCHSSCKISLHKVLLLFGSGRPSTNGLIAFDLRTNTFHRPTVSGIIPQPRFTGVAAFLDEGYVVTHGGYSSQESDALDRMDVLDLCPALRKRGFSKLQADTGRRSWPPITDVQAEGARRSYGRDAIFHLIYGGMMGNLHEGIIRHQLGADDFDSDDDDDYVDDAADSDEDYVEDVDD